MTNWITTISLTITMIATVSLAVAAWQAKKSFLHESLYNDSWELHKKLNDLKMWVFSNRGQLDEELLTKEKAFCGVFREKLDAINFLYLRVKHFYRDKLESMGAMLSDLDSVWLIYATKQNSPDVDKYKFKILQKLTNDDTISSQLYNSIVNKMK